MTDAETKTHDSFVVVPTGDFQARNKQMRVMLAGLLLCFVLSAGSLLFVQSQIRGTQKTNGTKSEQTLQNTQDIKHILTIAEGLTSPHAEQATQAEIASILSQVDCNTQRDLDARFIAAGLLTKGQTGEQCDAPTTTAPK